MTWREVMKRLSKLRDDQLDYNAITYFRDVDRSYEIDSLQISKKEDDQYDLDQPFMIV
jgi:hypothetical protein